ncbi:GlxA family transcriptional regulator [Bordetella flabilis]|uniref:AraC family transcriptional regulator n=1 Tax=Bordetella flabilis TaxID=463014 RepID=A0A193GDF1_9BORD|nr:helix-turn-helix domain-containing protein [Bordetella flabilis]ANN77486.1 AraC family transcriptional regulator [Bordetella flabilis]
MHRIAVLALHDFVPYDLGIACEVFARARTSRGAPAYAVQVCGPARTIRSRAFEMRVFFGLDAISRADTVLIPGIEDAAALMPGPVLAALRAAWQRGARLAAICSGAFVLAATGLLDGRRATTHWAGTAQLAQRYPKIRVEPDVLFVDEGRIITSAGASAGLDMCLHLIRRDHGQAVAAHSARLAVAPLTRDGGQSQFIRHELPSSDSSLAALIHWMTANLDKPLNVDTLAARAGMSPRTFARRFREQTGTTPLQCLLLARVQRAQALLEEGRMSIDRVAARSGFDSPVTFRARFRRVVGVTPTEYRRRFSMTPAKGRR